MQNKATITKVDTQSLPKGDALSLPKGWEMKRLGEVSEYFNGLTYSPKDVSDKGTIVLRSSNIQNDELDFSDLVRVSVNVKEKLFLKEGDILMCSRNGSQRLVGKTAPILNLEEPMTFGTFMMIIRSEFYPYLLWFFKTDKFKKQISGGENTMINQVTRYMLDKIEIPLPPLPEQQRIVALLDEAFAAIDKAKANAEQNLKNAKELFENYLQGVFENGNWERKKWGDLCDFVRGPFGGSLKKSIFKEEGYVVYEQKHAIHDHFNQLRYFIDEDKFNEMIRFELKVGDIIMSCSGVTLGRVAIVPEGIKRGIINQALLKLTPKKNVSVHFIKHWLRSRIFQKIIFDFAGGAAIPNVPSAKILKDILIPFPTIQEQEKVVNDIELMLVETKKLEAIYTQKIMDLEELKKSVLQKAFAGELKTNIVVV